MGAQTAAGWTDALDLAMLIGVGKHPDGAPPSAPTRNVLIDPRTGGCTPLRTIVSPCMPIGLHHWTADRTRIDNQAWTTEHHDRSDHHHGIDVHAPPACSYRCSSHSHTARYISFAIHQIKCTGVTRMMSTSTPLRMAAWERIAPRELLMQNLMPSKYDSQPPPNTQYLN